jgi:hypothetical protein
MAHKVIIELVFNSSQGDSDEEMTVLDVDVYDHLEDLIGREALDYVVIPESNEVYGVIRYKDIRGVNGTATGNGWNGHFLVAISLAGIKDQFNYNFVGHSTYPLLD